MLPEINTCSLVCTCKFKASQTGQRELHLFTWVANSLLPNMPTESKYKKSRYCDRRYST